MPSRVLLSMLVLAVASSACAFDYLVRPVPPETTQDAATSVFLDFRSKAPGADGVKLDPSAFTDAGGYRAAAIVPRGSAGLRLEDAAGAVDARCRTAGGVLLATASGKVWGRSATMAA